MPADEKRIMAFGQLRLTRRVDGTCYLSSLAYMPGTAGQVVEENIIETFYTLEDGMAAFMRLMLARRN